MKNSYGKHCHAVVAKVRPSIIHLPRHLPAMRFQVNDARLLETLHPPPGATSKHHIVCMN